ncbi:hypothetical protein [Beihai barnacle virus 3]|uniref:hypothetical protein n=1 Tax=Beihai barnacle virus 3 TaxID=1922361 RepID=UPI00090C1E9A|nr:hypothetical protein [Beihai barnacle virus 3]APG77568.1 hypothetical protein [Beihai barnacle virus 3]
MPRFGRRRFAPRRGRARGGPARPQNVTVNIKLSQTDANADGSNPAVYVSLSSQQIIDHGPVLNGIKPAFARIRGMTLEVTSGAAATTEGIGAYMAWRGVMPDTTTMDLGATILEAATRRSAPGISARHTWRNFPTRIRLRTQGAERTDIQGNVSHHDVFGVGVTYPKGAPPPLAILKATFQYGGADMVSAEVVEGTGEIEYDHEYPAEKLTRDFLDQANEKLGIPLGYTSDSGAICFVRMLVVYLCDSKELYAVNSGALTSFKLPYESFVFPARSSSNEGKLYSRINAWCQTPITPPGAAPGEVYPAHADDVNLVGDFEHDFGIHDMYVRSVMITPMTRTAGEVLTMAASGAAAVATYPVIPASSS